MTVVTLRPVVRHEARKPIHNPPAHRAPKQPVPDVLTDEDVLRMKRVTPAVASKFLRQAGIHISPQHIRELAKTGRCKFADWYPHHDTFVNNRMLVDFKNGVYGKNPIFPKYIPLESDEDED